MVIYWHSFDGQTPTPNMPLCPKGFNIYKTQDSLDGKPFIAYYVIADLTNKELVFTTDTTSKKRLLQKIN